MAKGKHEMKGTPTTGNGVTGGKKPKKESILMRWATGAIQVRATRAVRGTSKKGPFDR